MLRDSFAHQIPATGLIERSSASANVSGVTVTHFEEIHDFVAAVGSAQTAADLSVLMETVTRKMGFDRYALVRHVKQFTIKARNQALHNYPTPWIEYYIRHNLQAWDPVLRASLRSSTGFRFDDMPRLIHMSRREKDVMELCRDRGGISDGFNVPAHIPGELSVSCTFVVLRMMPFPDGNLLAAQLAGTYACEAARRIMWPPTTYKGYPDAILTARQLECVLLVGKGKTDWEIAQLLSINEETVTAHLNEARRRYGVGRRAELPLRAVYRGDLGFGDIFE